MGLAERVSIMRRHETDCYSLCFYLLQCENLACKAAQNALFNLITCDSFFSANAETASDMLRKESIRTSLQLMKEQMFNAR